MKKILVVEDEVNARDSLEIMLSIQGHEVITEDDPSFCHATQADVCSCPRSEPCADIMLIDNQMPYKSGVELLKLHREKACNLEAANKAIISAFITDYDSDELARMGVRHFVKPFIFSGIMDWIDQRLAS